LTNTCETIALVEATKFGGKVGTNVSIFLILGLFFCFISNFFYKEINKKNKKFHNDD